jgi:hypothetical protein
MTYFNVALFALSFVGYVTYISKKLKLGLGAAPFVYCCFVAVLLYFFGVVDLLVWGSWLATAIGIGLLIYEVFSSTEQHVVFAKSALYALLMLLLVCWFYWAIEENFRFLLWDEFSFWAASTKLIYTTNSLFKENSPIFLKSYPPIQQLFQYYVLQFFSWSEKNALFAQDIWLLSGALLLASRLRLGMPTKAALFLSLTTLVYACGYSFSSIYSDALLGMFFAAAVNFASKEEQSLSTWFALSLSLSVLILLKEIGILLALVAIVIYASNMVLTSSAYTARSSLEDGLSHPRVSVLSRLQAHWLKIFSLVALIVFVMQSWALYVKSIGAARALTIPSLAQWLDEPHQKRLWTTLAEFAHRVLETGYVPISVPFTQWHPTILLIVGVLSLFSVLVIYQTRPQQRLFYGVTLGILFLGFWGYTAALVLSYLVIFTEYEGVRLASFERYLSSYLLAWASFILVNLFASREHCNRKINFLLVSGCFVVLTLMTSGQFLKDLSGIRSVGPDYQLRQEIEGFADQIKKHIQPEQKIYFIAQKSNGLERVMFYYAMLPNTVSMSWCWSLGPKYFEGDVWTCNQEVKGLVDGYDYLALYRGDDQFWDLNKSFFSPASVGGARGLYKIEQQNGQIHLTRVADK